MDKELAAFYTCFHGPSHEDMWEKRRKRKDIGRMAWLLRNRISRPMMHKRHRDWIIVDIEDTQGKESRRTDHGTGVGNCRPVAFPDQVSGTPWTVPETPIASRQTTLVKAAGVPLVKPLGHSIRPVSHWWAFGRLTWNAPMRRYAHFYATRRPRKMTTEYLEN